MNKSAIIGMILCLLLTACGSGASATSPLGQAAGLDGSETLLVVNGREISAWQYLYWLAVDCQRLEAQYRSAGERLDWSASQGGGETLEAAVKAAAMEDTVLCAVTALWAENYGCVLSEEERAALPGWDTPWLTEVQGRSMAETGGQYAKLYTLCRTPGSLLAPAAGELETFAEGQGLLAAERIFVSASGGREAARQQISQLFARLNSAEDPAAVFSALLAETGGGAMADAEWTDVLRAAATALEPGQTSGILESDRGFWILRRSAVEEALLWPAYFDNLLRQGAERSEIQVTAAYDALQPADFWATLRKLEET